MAPRSHAVGFVTPPSAEAPPDSDDADRSTQTEHAIRLDASPDEVWSVIADDDELSAWLGTDAELDVSPGGEGHVIDDDGVLRRIRVEDVDEGRSIRWSWWPDADESGATVVEITIEPNEEGTEVHVVEIAPSASVGGGWSGRLMSMELCLLVKGELVPVRPLSLARPMRPATEIVGLSRSVMRA